MGDDGVEEREYGLSTTEGVADVSTDKGGGALSVDERDGAACPVIVWRSAIVVGLGSFCARVTRLQTTCWSRGEIRKKDEMQLRRL